MSLPIEADFALIKLGDGGGTEVFTIWCGGQDVQAQHGADQRIGHRLHALDHTGNSARDVGKQRQRRAIVDRGRAARDLALAAAVKARVAAAAAAKAVVADVAAPAATVQVTVLARDGQPLAW